MLRKVELFVSGLLTLMVIWLHVIAATSAGALWRDEANTIGLATLPSVGDVWKNLQYDSFPLLWLLILREFCAAFGPMNDVALRVLGLCVGIGIVGSLWLIARQFGRTVPLVSLVLLGLCPSLITWGDSVRAYGFGILLSLLTCVLMLRLVERPSPGRFAALALMSLASVQTLYYNSVVLLALCAGAVAVCARRRDWLTLGMVLSIGVIAATSMIPYVSTIRSAATWNALVQIPDYTFERFWIKLNEALRPSGYWTIVIWAEAFVVTVVATLRALRSKTRGVLSPARSDILLFCLITALVGIPALYLFLDILSYQTEPWYYLSLLALTGVCIDGMIGGLIYARIPRVARLAGVLILAGGTIGPALRAVHTRMTDIDIVATRVQSAAGPKDIVVVARWMNGVTFSRYYRGVAPWMTIPPIGFHRFHRFDLLGHQMLASDQSAPARRVTIAVTEALRAGHSVFVVGSLLAEPGAGQPEPLPAASLPLQPMSESAYSERWTEMVGYFLERHANAITILPVNATLPLTGYEHPGVIVAKGWRE